MNADNAWVDESSVAVAHGGAIRSTLPPRAHALLYLRESAREPATPSTSRAFEDPIHWAVGVRRTVAKNFGLAAVVDAARILPTRGAPRVAATRRR